jgi:hypothetical protein
LETFNPLRFGIVIRAKRGTPHRPAAHHRLCRAFLSRFRVTVSELVRLGTAVVDAPQGAARSPGDQPKNRTPNQYHCEDKHPDGGPRCAGASTSCSQRSRLSRFLIGAMSDNVYYVKYKGWPALSFPASSYQLDSPFHSPSDDPLVHGRELPPMMERQPKQICVGDLLMPPEPCSHGS